MAEQQTISAIIVHKMRQGRWSDAEHQKFLMALQIYGANWKKMKHLFENRTLSQIRSHAQKYFEKVGKKERIKYQRMAKLIQAQQIKSLQEQESSENRLKFFTPKIQTKLQQPSNLQILYQQKGLQQENQRIVQQLLIKEQHLQNSQTIIPPYNTLMANSDHNINFQKRTNENVQNHGHLYNIVRANTSILDFYGISLHPSYFFFN